MGEMPYRAAGVREGEPHADERPRATFRVRHRNATGLGLALLVAASAVAFGVGMMLAPGARTLAPLALAGPTILLAAAVYRTFELAAEVELVVEAAPEKGIVKITLRRRWGLLPWSAPLELDDTSVPSLATTWETSWSSSRYGRSRELRRASLALDVQGSAVALPRMRGPGRNERGVLVFDHTPAVEEAIARYEEGAAALRKALHGSTKRARRKARDRVPLGTPLLLARTDGAFCRQAAGALVAGVSVSALLALAAHFLPASNVTIVCAALVLPVLGSVIALVAAATANGSTLHFERRGAAGTSVVWRQPDLFLFGPLAATAPRPLGPSLEFYVKELQASVDATTRYALVDARTGETLFEDDHESVVERFGERIDGRRVEPPSGPRG